MTYLWIFFVIAVALAPLSHFVPSKRQRKVARMREYAAVHGLFVEFRQLPRNDVARAAASAGGQSDTIYYGKRLPPPREKRVPALAWICDQQQWRGLDRHTPVPPQLVSLPDEVLAASADESSCGVYWREAGDEAGVEQIRLVLEAWSQDLRP